MAWGCVDFKLGFWQFTSGSKFDFVYQDLIQIKQVIIQALGISETKGLNLGINNYACVFNIDIYMSIVYVFCQNICQYLHDD